MMGGGHGKQFKLLCGRGGEAEIEFFLHRRAEIKGIVHLNIIFSYMKVNKICNLDHPVY